MDETQTAKKKAKTSGLMKDFFDAQPGTGLDDCEILPNSFNSGQSVLSMLYAIQ